MDDQEWVGLAKLSSMIDTSPSTIREWIRSYGFPCYQPVYRLKFRMREVTFWMEQRKGRKGRKKKRTTVSPAGARTVASGASITTPT